MKKTKKRRIDWRMVLSILLMVTVLGAVAALITTDRSVYERHLPKYGYYEVVLVPDELVVEDYPNAFPDLRGTASATVNGATVESAVVNMGAGRINIAEVDTSSTFTATLGGMSLYTGFTYFGFYRTETTDFAPLPLATELGPFAVELADVGTEAVWSGDLATGLTVSEDTTATVSLVNCMDGDTPHIEAGVYQIYIIAIEK